MKTIRQTNALLGIPGREFGCRSSETAAQLDCCVRCTYERVCDNT
jgi:hypothetical protein